jgi:hypothetical protein
MASTVSVLGRVADRCVVRDHYGVLMFTAPALPPSPFACPRCGAPFWSRLARCTGRDRSPDAAHPSVPVTPRAGGR